MAEGGHAVRLGSCPPECFADGAERACSECEGGHDFSVEAVEYHENGQPFLSYLKCSVCRLGNVDWMLMTDDGGE